MIDDIALFVKIVECNSLAGAARQLGYPKATVTRRLKKLEDQLGFQLLHRNARSFSLTIDGESYFQAYAPLVHQFHETTRSLNDQKDNLKGPLKVLAPTNISLGILRPMWSEFVRLYPEIELDLNLSNTIEDITQSQCDLALRIGPQADSSLYQKKLGAIPTILVASPDYLDHYGTPQHFRDLSDHRLIMTPNLPKWILTHTLSHDEKVLNLTPSTRVNDISLAAHLCTDGLGVSLLPLSETLQGMQQGQLQRLFPDWIGPVRDIFAIWPSGHLLNAKAKKLRHFMEEYMLSKLDLHNPHQG